MIKIDIIFIQIFKINYYYKQIFLLLNNNNFIIVYIQ